MATSVLFGLGHHNEASTRRVERKRTLQLVPASTADSSGAARNRAVRPNRPAVATNRRRVSVPDHVGDAHPSWVIRRRPA